MLSAFSQQLIQLCNISTYPADYEIKSILHVK
nr:MAG TPA: hypothetical protein [Caudoviricetes sp.]